MSKRPIILTVLLALVIGAALVARAAAEDFVEYVSLAATPSEEEGGDVEAFPCSGSCLQTFNVDPHDPGEGECKY